MKILLTAGPTREPLDPVRYLTNRSSGRMGYALASAALAAGHEVMLISGPVALVPPVGVSLTQVETARQMFDAVQNQIRACDVAIFAAAVADYRPREVAAQKIKKSGDRMVVELERTEDILGSARTLFRFAGLLVGFAAETENLVMNAQTKLSQKQCDLVFANDVSQSGVGFDSAENAVTVCFASGEVRHLLQQPKERLANQLMEIIAEQVTQSV